MSPARMAGELLAGLEVARAAAARPAPTDSYFRSGRSSSHELDHVLEVEHARDRIDEVVGDAEPLLQPLAAAPATSSSRPRGASPRRSGARRSSSSTASSRSSASSETSRSASRVTRNADALEDLHPREEAGQEVRRSPARAGPPRPSRADRRAKRGRPSGTFTRAKRSSPVSGSRTKTREAERERRDVGERLARARPRAASARGRSRARSGCRARRAPRGAAPRRARRRSPRAASAGHELVAPRPATAAAYSSSTRLRASASACCGVRPSGERTVTPAAAWLDEPGDPHHEELVEHLREDRAELHPLEQRHVGVVRRARARAGVVVEPRELAVDADRSAAAAVRFLVRTAAIDGPAIIVAQTRREGVSFRLRSG